MSKKTWHQPELISLEATALTQQLADAVLTDDAQDAAFDALSGDIVGSGPDNPADAAS